MASHRSLPAPRRSSGDGAIVVVSGLPRSGTSMAMKMLAAGGFPILSDGVRRADEDNPEGYFELEAVKELPAGRDTSWLDGSRGKAVKIVSYHLRFLPPDREYRVIFMRRRLEEILASQSAMMRRRRETGEESAGTIAAAWRDHLVFVRTVLELRPEFSVLELWYHEVVAEPLAAARRISGFLGRSLKVEAMAGAVNPSLYRNRLASAETLPPQ